MNLSLYLVVACSILCELLSGVLLINRLTGEEKKIPKRWALAFAIVAALYILIVPNNLAAGCYVLTLLYTRYGYKEVWKDSLIITIISVVLGGVVELLCSFPFVVVLHGRWTDTTNNFLAAFCSVIVCYFLGRIPQIQYLKRWCSRRGVLYVIVALFCLLLMLSTIVNFQMTLELDVGDYIYILMAVTLIWFLSLRLMRYQYEDKVRKKYLDAFRKVINQIKIRQHKFQNQLDAIYSLHRIYDDYNTLVEAQRRYLGKLADYELPTDVLILENPIVIAHLYEKINEAQKTGVRIRLRLSCSLLECGIHDIHLVEILGTFLDNAIQDMQTAGETEFLYLEVKQEERIIVRVANPHRKLQYYEFLKMFEMGYSTKGENRGVGLYQVKKLAQKYNSELLTQNQVMDGKNYICFTLKI